MKNVFLNEQGVPIQRPGINQIKELDIFARGHFVWNESRYVVFSTKLLKITDQETGDFEEIGTIAGVANIQAVEGQNHAVIIVKADDGPVYTLDKLDDLVDVSANANIPASRSIAAIDKRIIYVPWNGDPVVFSDVGAEATVQGLSVFDAEQLPDKNVAVLVLRNNLMIMGTDSTEIYQNIGTTPVPFQRRSGGAIDNGLIGGLIKYGLTYLFIGREVDQDFGIYAFGNGIATRVSNEAIDEILASYSLEVLAAATPGRIRWLGNDLATFVVGQDSFGYKEGKWFLLESQRNNQGDVFGAGFITEFEGKYYTAFSNKLGVFEDINTDYGEEITKEISFGIEEQDGLKFPVQWIEAGTSQGFNARRKINGVPVAPGSMALQLSKDNITYSAPSFIDFGKEGDYSKKIRWNRLGSFEGFLGIKLYCRSNVKFNLDYISINAQGNLIQV